MKYRLSALDDVIKNEVKDSNWAKEVNVLTARVHRDVWFTLPNPSWVESELIPRFQGLVGMVREVLLTGGFGKNVDHYANCIQMRARQMQRYVQGLSISHEEVDRLMTSQLLKNFI